MSGNIDFLPWKSRAIRVSSLKSVMTLKSAEKSRSSASGGSRVLSSFTLGVICSLYYRNGTDHVLVSSQGVHAFK